MNDIIKQLAATLGFFTRLPIWRLVDVPKSYYEHVVPYWPMVGYLNGALMFVVVCATSHMPVVVSAILCLLVRALLTGCLHEDGFADFCDGFGGGYDKDSILRIMKDSHIGTYGVIGLIFYYMLQVNALSWLIDCGMPHVQLLLTLVFADAYCKFVSSTIICFLPYARKESESKNQLLYRSSNIGEKVTSVLLALLPALLLCCLCGGIEALSVFVLPLLACPVVAALLFAYCRKKIGGYTGDCCGATFVVMEVVFYMLMSAS